jgi:hypothetical protein
LVIRQLRWYSTMPVLSNFTFYATVYLGNPGL